MGEFVSTKQNRRLKNALLLVMALLLLPLGPILVTGATRSTALQVQGAADSSPSSNVEVEKKKHKNKKKCKAQSQSESSVNSEGKKKKKKKKCPNAEVMLAVGDVAYCNAKDPASEQNLAASARYINNTPGSVAVLGDLAYQFGTPDEFRDCYGKYYGSFVSRTYPTPGNHEYYNNCHPTSTSCIAAPYFDYFKGQAGIPAEVQNMAIGEGWYSYTLGNWKIYVLNSNGSEPKGDACGWVACQSGSAQYQWLQAELDKDQKKGACSLAYWHHPLFNSGSKGGSPQVKGWWELLYQSKAEIVLNGHEHMYERFAPQTPDGASDPQRGILEFIVGTGGAEVDKTAPKPTANSEVRLANTVGVLNLTLRQNGYDFAFIDSHSGAVLDSGSGACH